MVDLDPSIHAFVVNLHDKNATFYWPESLRKKYQEKYDTELKDDVASRMNNFEILELINDEVNEYVQGYTVYEILVVDKEAERGIDFVSSYAFFNPYKYMIKKLQNVVVDVNASSYISLMTHRVRAMRPEKHIIML